MNLKPYLKWAGGKRQLLPEIKKHLPTDIHNLTFYEPFVGAGAVLFDLQPKKAVINDSNEQLILTYIVIKENVKELIDLLNQHKEYFNKENYNEEYYYKIRNIDRDKTEFDKLSNIEKAARLIFLNKTCYNGLYRVNSKDRFNTPYGKYKNPSIYDEETLYQISNYLNSNKITILNSDFESAITDVDKNSFIYFDPPYHSPKKTNFTSYQADGFNEDEQKRLRDVMQNMTDKGIKCLLSNSDTQFIRELYKDKCFKIFSVNANRLINSKSTGRGNVGEVLVRNW